MSVINSSLFPESKNRILPYSFNYNQLSVIPRLSSIAPEDVKLQTRITTNITSSFPFLASPMDTVIGETLAIKIIEQNGVPIFHSFLGEALYTIIENIQKRFSDKGSHLGLLISPDLSNLDIVAPLFGQGISVVALDTLHQKPHLHLQAISELKNRFPDLEIISGNIVYGEDCQALAEAGVNAIRVGMTSASINQGRVLVGCGRQQAVAVWHCAEIAKALNIPIIADGGIKTISDAVIAFALGADTVMMGQMFARLSESAAPKTVNHAGQPVKIYRGMSQTGKISRDLIAEGNTKELTIEGSFDEVIVQWFTVLQLAISRAGFTSLDDFKNNALLELVN